MFTVQLDLSSTGTMISLACLSSESHNLQRVFCPGGGGGVVVPYLGYIGMCRAKGNGFFSLFSLK